MWLSFFRLLSLRRTLTFNEPNYKKAARNYFFSYKIGGQPPLNIHLNKLNLKLSIGLIIALILTTLFFDIEIIASFLRNLLRIVR